MNSLFAQRRNLLRPSFLRMIADILRFNARARAWLDAADSHDVTLGEFIDAGVYSRQFVEHYIVPMGRAIWSAEASAMLVFPARFFIGFFDRHGFLNVDDRPVWQTVSGGSREYVRALLAAAKARVRLSTPIASIRRLPNQVLLRTRAGDVEAFDHVFLACHSDQALALLEAPTPAERERAGRDAVCRRTRRSCTPTPACCRDGELARAAWNYHLLRDPQEPVALTYDMNVLQGLRDAPVRFLVTLNHRDAIDPSCILRSFQYAHPVYTPAGVAAQARHRELNGVQRTYFCGAYWRSGFHEDGVVSAQSALAHFGEDLERAQLPLPRVG